MTTYTPRDLSGSLFKNDKGDNPNRPDYRGDICIGGVVYSLAAWIKEGQRGKFMSIKATPRDEQPTAPAQSLVQSPAQSPAPAPRRMTQAELDARAAAERRQQERAAPVRSGTAFDDMSDDIVF